MKRGLVFVAAALGMMVPARSARADLRSFTQTYEYSTVPEEKTTVELWHTQTRATTAGNSPHRYEGILEIEHGVTEHWDIGVVTVLEQTAAGATFGGPGMAGQPLHLSRVELETRYRLSERGELPIDTEGFLELGKQFGDSIYTIEARLIGARDFGDLTFAANAIGEVRLGKDVPETDVVFGWAAGATYQALPKLRIGVESWGVVVDGTPYADVGPALSFAAARSFWAAITIGFAVTERDALVTPAGAAHGAFSARAILGIEL